MSNFKCEKCGVTACDSARGYVSGCVHYPPDIKPMIAFGKSLCIISGEVVNWYIDEYGTKRRSTDDSEFLS